MTQREYEARIAWFNQEHQSITPGTKKPANKEEAATWARANWSGLLNTKR